MFSAPISMVVLLIPGIRTDHFGGCGLCGVLRHSEESATVSDPYYLPNIPKSLS